MYPPNMVIPPNMDGMEGMMDYEEDMEGMNGGMPYSQEEVRTAALTMLGHPLQINPKIRPAVAPARYLVMGYWCLSRRQDAHRFPVSNTYMQ